MTAHGAVMLVPEKETTGPSAPLAGARAALLLLLAINLFNYIDRQVLAAVLPKIDAQFLQGDPHANEKLGWLTTAFLISYMLLAPVFGLLADRMSRWSLVAIGVILWSLASGASGLAGGFVILLLTRCFVGVGEAAYGPVAPTMISDYYPINHRGRVLSWFYTAIPVGGALGYVLGGLVADSALGWRWAFFLVVPPGLALGLLCYLMREPPRGQSDAVPGAEGAEPRVKTNWRDYLVLARTPSFVLNTLGMTAMTFAVGGLAAWIPTYIYEREAACTWDAAAAEKAAADKDPVPGAVLARLRPLKRQEPESLVPFRNRLEKLLPPEEFDRYGRVIIKVSRRGPSLGSINMIFGAIVVVSGLVATLLGGSVGDRLRPRFPGSYFLISGIAMLIGFPLVFAIPWVPFPLAWGLIFLAVFCLFFNTGPTNTILANVTHPAVRATGFAVNILIIHLLGDAISPVVFGAVADAANKDVALQTLAAVILAGGVFWLWGTPYLARDTARAPTRLGHEPTDV